MAEPSGGDGLFLPPENTRQVHYSGEPALLLRAVRAALPPEAIVYLERPADSAFARLLASQPAAHPRKVRAGTIWPKGPAFHITNASPALDAAIAFAETHAAPELAEHLVVYDATGVLVSAYDLGDRMVDIARDMGEQAARRFLDALLDVQPGT